jgi:hypothetical protein
MKITDVLKKYRYKKARIDTAYARIKGFEEILKLGNFSMLQWNNNSDNFGMPKARNNQSIIETEIMIKDNNIKITAELVKQLIKNEKSRIFPLEQEIKLIDKALNALSQQDRYIVELKYMDNLDWRDVEISFFEQYRKNLTEIRLKQIAAESISMLNCILNEKQTVIYII